MTSSSPSSDSSSDTSDYSGLPPNSLAGLSLSIFAELLSNLTHDIALQSHRSEKLLRTKQQHLHPPSDGSPPPTTNPLAVVPAEILCPRCHLPQHTSSTPDSIGTGTGSQKKKFCPRLPFQSAPLHDIYGNPFPTIKDNGNKNKTDKSAGGTDSPAEDGGSVVGKKSGVVYFKCTSCENEKVLSSRYAAHLEKCLGLAGRKSSRAAMAKMNSNSGSGVGSPMLSAADATGNKTASRKASPEKKSKSPVPGLNGTEEVPAAVAAVAATKPTFASSAAGAAGIAAAATATTTTTPKKKKKKVAAAALAAAAAAAAAKSASVPPDDDKSHPAPPDTPTKPIDVPPLPPLPPPATSKDPTAPTQKKRKRKAEAAAAAAASAAGSQGSTAGAGDDKDGSITLSSKPPVPKKQKLSAGDKLTAPESTKKSQLNKFKNRANSPSPGGGSIKKGEIIRTSSPNPPVPPAIHKSLPPKPPTPLGPLSSAMGTSGSSQGISASASSVTPKPKKPKPGAIGTGLVKKAGGDGGSVKKSTKPKMKKGVGANAGVGAGKTVPVPRVAGKSVPGAGGVARKGPKD